MNKNRKYRFRKLHYLVNDTPLALKKTVLALFPRSLLRAIKTRLQKVNTVTAPRADMSTQTRVRLNEIYRDEVRQLSELLDRDLTHWLDNEST